MKLFKKFTLSLASVAVLSLLVACSNNQAQTPTTSSTTTSTSSSVASSETSSSNASSSQSTTNQSNIDGTYTGTDEGDRITLEITGDKGTWTSVEPDGEQEIKPVTVDHANQRLTVGDDVKFYQLNGNQLTIEDDDRDPSDTITLTK